MAFIFIWEFLLIFSQFLLLVSAEHEEEEKCPPSFDCGYLGQISFPFTTAQYPHCGTVAIHGCHDKNPFSNKTIQVNNHTPSRQFFVVNVDHHSITVSDYDQHERLHNKDCRTFDKNFTLPPASPLASYYLKNNITMFRCNPSLRVLNLPKFFHNYTKCSHSNIYYGLPNTEKPRGGFELPTTLARCSAVQVAVKGQPDGDDPFEFLSSDMVIEVELFHDCHQCFYRQKGHCQLDTEGKFYCDKAETKRSLARKLGLGIGLPAIIIAVLLIIWCYKSRSVPDFNSNPYPEGSSVYFGVPVFSYTDLEVATKKFDRSRELGEGGFGTVYYGKLKDGREVAVKRLYEHNYKRAQQFVNEIKILTRLRHKNLVSLYGCTSCHGQELLLVYEYISNGTVASHLRCESTSPAFLPWSIRMKVALETATALAYLHASDIIHRDVKTNNILLDSNFCIKVADFGLSRLFPNDVTHVSTAPQGTPGYVDPEYHQCYQLTNKSDVYSFGVVLVELISSLPAVDMTRHKDEINLANLAIRKIQKGAIGELVDPSLGFESDGDVRRKIVSIAELAFQCLQRDKELRPSMGDVLEVLRRIESGKTEPGHLEEVLVYGEGMSHSDVHPLSVPSPDHGEVNFFKNMNLTPSPNTVTENWDSELTTPNVSGQSASQI